MQIDRRITNGLAWAGAALVIAIPAADAALRQFGPADTPQIAVVEEQPAPAPVVLPEREPAETPETAPPVVKKPVAEPQSDPAPTAKPDPIATASAAGGAVGSFLQSGRKLPSYISDGGQTERADTAALNPTESTIEPVATLEPEPVAAPPTKTVTFPTPVFERPASVARSAVAPQPPLVIEQADIVVTAEDLEDWESGPLSDFLARRQAEPAPSDYDPDGFFLDEGPNSSARVNRFPRAYSYDDYAFE